MRLFGEKTYHCRHGDAGRTILHKKIRDALTLHYLENSRTADNPDAPYLSLWEMLENADLSRSTFALFKGDFFRIDQLRLDYTLPVRKARLNLYASMENWFLLTRYPGTDPELALAWESFGYETATYPATRRIVFGLQVGF